MKKKMHKKSIFTNSILLFLAIAVLIFLLGTYIVVRERNILTKQYEKAVETQIMNYYAQLEKELQTIKVQQDTLVYDSDFTYLLNKDVFDYNVSRAINSVGTKLMLIEESCDYVDEVQIYFQSLDNSIVAKDNRMQYMDADTDFISSILNQRRNVILEYYNKKLYILSASRGYVKEIKDNSYVVISSLSMEQLFQDIKQFELDTDATSMLAFDNYDICMTDKEKKEIFQEVLKDRQWDSNIKITYTTVDDVKYLVVGYYSKYLQSRYAQAIPVKSIFSEVDKIKNLYLIFSAVTVTAILLFIWYLYKSIKKPLNLLMEGFGELEKEKFDIKLKHSTTDEFSVVFESFNGMTEKLRRLINDVYMQKILVQKAELRQLQAQINPHFLYNSFFILKNRITSGSQAEAQKFCEMLGMYFSYITKNYKDYSTLKEEVEHARIYADIQAIRFADRIEVSFDELPAECKNIRIPKLILQPILENAFKYGLEGMEFDGLLHVGFVKEKELLQIIVEDNGSSFSDNDNKLKELNDLFWNYEQIKEPSGMFNINRRIKILFGGQYGIQVQKSPALGGLMVVVSLRL